MSLLTDVKVWFPITVNVRQGDVSLDWSDETLEQFCEWVKDCHKTGYFAVVRPIDVNDSITAVTMLARFLDKNKAFYCKLKWGGQR
jgi:hypothetical protein